MHEGRQRGLLVGGGVLLALLVILCGTLGLAYGQINRTIAYPGATTVADQNLTRYTPMLVIRRTAAYRSGDSFSTIYNWYSRTFGLGPESHAQGSCILMARAWTTAWLIEQQMSVTVCTTPNDQMMFVMRSIGLRYRLP